MKKIIIAFTLIAVTIGCSTKKAGITNRTYHRMTSWYNAVFNGNDILRQHLDEKRKNYIDNYSKILSIEPIDYFDEFDVLTDFSSGETDDSKPFDRIRKKAIYAIEKHSIMKKNKEMNSMLGEAYLLIGRVYYYEKSSFNAINYLSYLDDKFEKSNKKNQALIYRALAQEQAENVFEANEAFLALSEKKLKKRDKKFASISYSQFLINQKKYEEAIASLDETKKYNKGKYNKGRFSYIKGQLYEELGNEEEAEKSYLAAYKYRPSPEMEVKTQVALAGLFKGDSTEYKDQIKSYKKLLKKGLYISKKNEIYYAMGLMATNQNRTDEAMNFYKKALSEVSSDFQIRGLTYKEIGDIYFDKTDYLYAGAYYDSAATNFTDKRMKEEFTKKSKILADIAEKYYLVKKNDSLLNLIAMPESGRISLFTKFIEDLKIKEEKERLELEKNEEQITFTLDSEGNVPFFSNNTQSSGKWYFYNNSAKQQGKKDFDRIWKGRNMGDNWRYGSVISSGDQLDNKRDKLAGTIDTRNPRRFEVDYYLEQIPTDENNISNIKIERDTIELALGLDYFQKLNDKKLSTNSLEHLVSTPPKEEDIKLRALYNLFRINEESNPNLAEKYKNQILSQFPNTKYAKFITTPTEELLAKSEVSTAKYKEIYEKYEKAEFAATKSMIEEYLVNNSTDEMAPKFNLLHAYNEARLGNKDIFLSELDNIAIRFREYPEGEKAESVLKYFGKEIGFSLHEKNKTNDSINSNSINNTKIINTNNEINENLKIEKPEEKNIEKEISEEIKEDNLLPKKENNIPGNEEIISDENSSSEDIKMPSEEEFMKMEKELEKNL